MLQKDSFFRRRDEPAFRPPSAMPPAPAANTPAAPAQASHHEPAPAKAAPAGDEHRKEAKLTVGPDIKMKGVEITDCDTLVVEGRLEATLDSRMLQIAQHGVFQGTVAVDVAEIHGRMEGELTVRKQLVLHATSKVTGKIRYARIKVEEGAEVQGEIAMLDKAGQPSATLPRRPLTGQPVTN